MHKPKLVILISGNGTNLQAVIDAVEARRLEADIACVVSNNPGAYGLTRAKKHNIAYEIIPHNCKERIYAFPTKQEFENKLLACVKSHNPDLIILAGFMLILSPDFVSAFPKKIINLHPAILPDNPQDDEIILPDGTTSKVWRGAKAIEDAWKSGVSYAGCSVHYVTPLVDRGEVIAKSYIKIDRNKTFDEFTEEVHKEEHKIIVEAARKIVETPRRGVSE